MSFSSDRCLWWDAMTGAVTPPPDLPARVDVAVVGGGYTGLTAARALARAGARVAVLERERIGWGASSRNGGMVLPGFKAEPAALIARVGRERARQLFLETLEAIGFVEGVIRDEGIVCDWRRSGHAGLAARPSHLRGLEQDGETLQREFGYATELLGPGAIDQVIGSTRYHGALVDPGAASLHPARYVAGLAAAARRAGAVLCEATGVGSVERDGSGFRLTTSRGAVQAGRVLIATDGYTGPLVPWLRRRLIPIGSYIIATEPIRAEVQRRLIPGSRMLSDTWNLLHYFRLSPDGRLVFGGRAAFVPSLLDRSVTMLRRAMLEVYPELGNTRIEFAWGGTLGFTRDYLPHAGERDGVAYALGYCGHGVACASWLGDRVGRVLAGKADWPAIADVPFPAIPLNWGRPWFLPLAGAYFGFRDRIG